MFPAVLATVAPNVPLPPVMIVSLTGFDRPIVAGSYSMIYPVVCGALSMSFHAGPLSVWWPKN